MGTGWQVWTLFHYFASVSNVDFLRVLVECGLNVNVRVPDGTTAMMCAAVHGSLDSARFMRDAGADIHAKDMSGRTALIHAAIGEQLECMRFLHQEGADIEVKDFDGWSALMHAARCLRLECMRYLHKNGADIEAEDIPKTHFNQGFMYDVYEGLLVLDKDCFERAMDIRTLGGLEKRILLLAISHGHEDIVKHLLSVLSTDNVNPSPLVRSASYSKSEDIAEQGLDAVRHSSYQHPDTPDTVD